MRTTAGGRTITERLELACALRGIQFTRVTKEHIILDVPKEGAKRFSGVAAAWEYYRTNLNALPLVAHQSRR